LKNEKRKKKRNAGQVSCEVFRSGLHGNTFDVTFSIDQNIIIFVKCYQRGGIRRI
jgi:hypothetical protein